MGQGSVADFLEELLGIPKTAISELPSIVSSSENGLRHISAPSAIKPEEYLGDEPLEEAKKYIASVGHAVHFEEIADAVSRGGAATQGSDWREKLETSLIRSTFEVVKVQEKTFGLTKFYSEEQLRRVRGTRRQAEPKNKRIRDGRHKVPSYL